ncbi:hypothetical protein [Lactococcus garvieae]|uniref:hypothetical protein n=1 Tax=Lactococcus garvieae TaxID=1363 RepID=UPI00288D719E|nr:hypothetical protein [Lactococcus garvieae]MDT2742360.1 hypothetical protein [Lactococcus garvieae]
MIELQEVTKKFGKHQIFDRYFFTISADNIEELHTKQKQAGFEVAELKGLPH